MEKSTPPEINKFYDHEAKKLAEDAFVTFHTFQLPNTSKFDLPLHLLPESLTDKHGQIANVELATEIADNAFNKFINGLGSQVSRTREFSEKGRHLRCLTIDSFLPDSRAYIIQEKIDGELPKTWLSTELPKEFTIKLPSKLEKIAKKAGQSARKILNDNPGHTKIWH